VKVKTLDNAPVGGGKRGQVGKYSAASRRRFQELFCSLPQEVLIRAWIGRLSWSDDNLPDGKEAKRCIDGFRRALDRHYPEFCIMWRLEIEPRKSGEHIGEPVPHIHYVVVSRDMSNFETFALWVAKAWHQITSCQDERHLALGIGTHLERVYGDPSRISWYVSKYTTKVSASVLPEFGWTGRWWGVIGRKNWPKASRVEVEMTAQGLVEFRRLARGWLRAKSRKATNYVKFIAKNDRVGFRLLGLPTLDYMLMVEHAEELAESRFHGTLDVEGNGSVVPGAVPGASVPLPVSAT